MRSQLEYGVGVKRGFNVMVQYFLMGITGIFWIGGLVCVVSDRQDRARLGWVLLVVGTFIYFVSGGFDPQM